MNEWPFDDTFDILSALKFDKPSQKLKTSLDINNKDIQKLAEWYASTPCFTTVRVNLVNTNVQQVIKIIKEQLVKKAEENGFIGVPNIEQDNILKDCIIVSPWSINNDIYPSSNGQNYYEVIVDTSCGISVLRGANVYAPGVMGMGLAVKEGDRVTVYADISKKCLKGFTKPYYDPHKKFLGYGIAKMTRKSLFDAYNSPNGIAIEMTRIISGVPSFVCPSEFGLLQNYPSILCCHVLNPQDGDLILDMCASPEPSNSIR